MTTEVSAVTADTPTPSAESVNNALSPEQGNPVTLDEQNPDHPEQPERKELTPAEKEAYALRRRVSRLTREKYQYEAKLAQFERQAQPAADENPNPKANAPSTEDLRAQARELVALERLNAKCDEVAARGEKAFSDFAEKVKELNAEVPIMDGRGVPSPFMEAILDADDPARLIHHLGSNPDVAAELADLSPRQQVRRLALIEKGLDAAPERKSSTAPTPLTPVKPGASSSAPDPAKDVDAYIAWRRKQRAGK